MTMVVDENWMSTTKLCTRHLISLSGLDEEELQSFFENLGRKVNKRTIANLMRLSDTDGNGVIDFEKFKVIWDKVQC